MTAGLIPGGEPGAPKITPTGHSPSCSRNSFTGSRPTLPGAGCPPGMSVNQGSEVMDVTQAGATPSATGRRRWPPAQMMAEMLREGRDLWIADLLDCSRMEVAIWRRSLGIPAFGRGGSAPERNRQCAEFIRKWSPKLQAMGFKARARPL